jgi:hypothetical protein
MLIQHLALHLPAILAAGPVDNPAPVNPVSGNGISLLISYAKYGALVACGLTAAISGGMIAFGQMSNRPDAADKGKRALIWSLVGAAVVALAIPTLNTIFGSA